MSYYSNMWLKSQGGFALMLLLTVRKFAVEWNCGHPLTEQPVQSWRKLGQDMKGARHSKYNTLKQEKSTIV